MKKLLLCVFFIPFIGLSQDSFTDNRTPLSGQPKNPPLLKYLVSDTGINTELSEIGYTFFKDKYLVISNKKRRHTKTTFNEASNQFNNNIYCTDVDKNGNLSYPLQFSTILDSDFNEGAMTFSPDEKTIYYTNTAENSSTFKLYKAVLDLEIQGYWKEVTEIQITTPEYSVETPFLNKTGDKIYFSSNMPGGFGGYDIYEADVVDDGSLKNIKNLGATVNTSSDEKYNFVSPNNKYIYFSSKGHDGYGGYDVFRASNTNEGYTNTANIGSGLNTVKDEVAYMLVNPKQGYISVNKEDDKQNFDVYRFEMEQKEHELSLLVVEDTSNIKLQNANVSIADEFGNKIMETKTNDNGEVKLNIEPLTQYSITIDKEGYDSKNILIKTSSDSYVGSETIKMNQKKAEIVEDAIVLEAIFFDFNQALLKEASELALNKVAKVMQQNPAMTISINAHTDAIGTEKYNQALSEKRAKAAYTYLTSKGIQKSRVVYKGYGESQLLHECESCSEIENQENRRVEFKISVNN